MVAKQYVLAHILIEVDTSHFDHFTEKEATSYFNSALRLGSSGSVKRTDVYLLSSKPGSNEDIIIEKYVYLGYMIEINQNASTVGSERPTYFAVVFNTKSKSGYGKFIDGEYDVILDAKNAAEKYVGRRAAQLEKRDDKIKD